MEFDALRDGLAASLLEVEHNLTPVVDATDRMRGELIGRGWTDAGAEAMATAWFKAMMYMGAKS
ncbi:hypothetical protein IPZ61_15755 [Streptomyces sioyaensis]|uniref:hypothetical protein n=1 Tax=Streptomyces sioyaensis TaxID=67364 RepID=UPI001F409206|nr:hypothetical protein [Streptomyces sioyaensis]MCF3174773.1 hypothetical protein [Streptomyces sioyaensis]